MPSMTLEQVSELVDRYLLINPTTHLNKGKKRTEAHKLEQAILKGKMRSPIYVYDVNWNLIDTHPSQRATAIALGVD